MSTEHVVVEGEHLAAIAAQHGFSGIDPIWSHPQNASLKELRKNPNVLLAGDRVFIPDKETKEVSGATQQRHTFQLSSGQLELHVKVHDQGFQPIHGDAVLSAGGTKTPMVQKGDIFEAPLDPAVKQADLEFPTSATSRQRPPITVEPGRLDPIDTLSGQQQRLNNLGYFAGFVKTQATDPKAVDLQLLWAVQEFQCDQLGPKDADGVLNKKTVDKLKEVYGV